MSLLLLSRLVSGHVDRQKRELLELLWESGAHDPRHAIDLSGMNVKPSILRSMVSRKVVRRTAAGRYFLDASRVDQAFGASGSFLLYAMAAFILAFLVIMWW
jgi:hypothetical protein